jgi:hypothetical protein
MERALELLKNLFKALIFWFFLPAPASCGDQEKRTVNSKEKTVGNPTIDPAHKAGKNCGQPQDDIFPFVLLVSFVVKLILGKTYA